jgi:formylglycine-generating enzyme required for sulfatase activity
LLQTALDELDAIAYHFDMDMQMTVAEEDFVMEIPVSFVGDFQPPDRVRGTISTTVLGMSIEGELITIGETTYSKDPDTGEWQISTGEESPLSPLDFGGIDPERVEDLAIVGEETVDDTPLYHLRGMASPQDMGDTFTGLEAEGELQLDCWIGVEDGRLRQGAYDGELSSEGTTITMTANILYSDYGQTVVIEPPEMPTPSPTPSLSPTATSPPPSPTPDATSAGPPAIANAGDTWTRPADSMVMVSVPAGGFFMGSTEEDIDAVLAGCSDCERDWFGDELPEHIVYLEAFWIDRTEVTNRQFRRCVRAGACEAPTTCDWGDPSFGGQGQAGRPVVCVSWDMAQAYCQWAGARLPTEAEWEKAARGTDRQGFPWGNDFDCSQGNFDDEQELDDYVVPGGPDCDGHGQSAPVGSYPSGASPYGALDLAGNVWEWVADWYADNYYYVSPDSDPPGPASGSYRGLRGGGWYAAWENVRAAFRFYSEPAGRYDGVGFRCAAAPSGN